VRDLLYVGFIKQGKAGKRILATLVTAQLPMFSPLLTRPLCENALKEAIDHRAGALNLVLPTDIGRAMFLERPKELSTSVVESAIHWLSEQPGFQVMRRGVSAACLVFDVGGTNLRAAVYDPENPGINTPGVSSYAQSLDNAAHN